MEESFAVIVDVIVSTANDSPRSSDSRPGLRSD